MNWSDIFIGALFGWLLSGYLRNIMFGRGTPSVTDVYDDVDAEYLVVACGGCGGQYLATTRFIPTHDEQVIVALGGSGG